MIVAVLTSPADEVLLAQLADDGRRLINAFGRCDPVGLVPGLDWDARTVVVHTGAVHRWAADIVRRALPTNETGGSAAFAPDELSDAELPRWFDAGLAALIDTLRAAPAELSCFTFADAVSARSFWIRRQAHETAIHRVDVEAAAGGPVTPFGAAFAQDGLAELVAGFAIEPGFSTERPGRLLLHASDGPSWTVTFGADRNRVEVGDLTDADPDTGADAVVTGSSDELYRWAWNRPVSVTPAGDPETIACWRRVRIA